MASDAPRVGSRTRARTSCPEPSSARHTLLPTKPVVLRTGAALGAQVRTTAGLGPSDYAALQVLDSLAGKAQPIGRLAGELHLSSAATTELVDRLEHAGLVRRERDTADRRRVLLVLDPSAQQLGRELLDPWHQRIERATRSLPSEHRRIVLGYLTNLLEDEPALDVAPAPS